MPSITNQDIGQWRISAVATFIMHFVGSASAPSPFQSRFVCCYNVSATTNQDSLEIRSDRSDQNQVTLHCDRTPERLALYNCSSCLFPPATRNQNKSQSLASDTGHFPPGHLYASGYCSSAFQGHKPENTISAISRKKNLYNHNHNPQPRRTSTASE